MMSVVFRFGPYAVAVLMVANGFYSVAAGLSEVFHLDRYLADELDEVRDYLKVVPEPQFGGFVEVFLGYHVHPAG